MVGDDADQDVTCALLWKLARTHGWSTDVTIRELARDANVRNETYAREVARTTVARLSYVGYHPGTDTIWLQGPPKEALFNALRDDCGYSELQIEATFSSYFDGFR